LAPTFPSAYSAAKNVFIGEGPSNQGAVEFVNRHLNHSISFENASAAREIGLESILTLSEYQRHKQVLEKELQLCGVLSKDSQASDFLCHVEPYLSEELISHQNYSEIKNLIDYFTGSVTSFFGFESSLSSAEDQSDFLFAVSARRGEREALADLFQKGDFPDAFCQKPEWQRIGRFIESWVDPQSILYHKILGLWFEFDSEDLVADRPIPNIFIHPEPIQTFPSKDASQHAWLFSPALSLLHGSPVSKKIERTILTCIQRLPPDASLFQVGIMLSRPTSHIRLVFKRMHPHQIIPYLKSVGWTDETDGLSSLLNELAKYVTRIVLHISVGETIDKKVGIECSFYPDLFNKETRWSDFLTYLTQKEVCLPEKKSAVIHFPGVEQEVSTVDSEFTSSMSAVKIPDNKMCSSALVRYISHIKLSYEPNYPLDAKVYSGVRLFGFEHDTQSSKQTMKKGK
jgi:hypothetical protein